MQTTHIYKLSFPNRLLFQLKEYSQLVVRTSCFFLSSETRLCCSLPIVGVWLQPFFMSHLFLYSSPPVSIFTDTPLPSTQPYSLHWANNNTISRPRMLCAGSLPIVGCLHYLALTWPPWWCHAGCTNKALITLFPYNKVLLWLIPSFPNWAFTWLGAFACTQHFLYLLQALMPHGSLVHIRIGLSILKLWTGFLLFHIWLYHFIAIPQSSCLNFLTA